MVNAKHGNQSIIDGIHIVHAFEYDDDTARTAASLVTADVGKLARQLDNNTFWILKDTTPTWVRIDLGGGDSNASYVVMSTTGSLTNGRILSGGIGVNVHDNGPGGAVDININDGVVATVSGTIFTGATAHNAGLSGSLTKLTDGSSYLVQGANITITSASNGAVTIASTASGAGGTSGLAFLTGTQTFTGDNTFNGLASFTAGLTGSLTRLTGGTSYIVGLNGISVSTSSVGQVVVTGTNDYQIPFAVGGNLAVGDDQTPWQHIGKDGDVIEAVASVKTPADAAITLEIQRTVSGSVAFSTTVVDSSVFYISSGSNIGSTNIIASPALLRGQWLRLNIDQVGTSVTGSNLQVFLRVRSPLGA